MAERKSEAGVRFKFLKNIFAKKIGKIF
jgi:hypothetical protein